MLANRYLLNVIRCGSWIQNHIPQNLTDSSMSSKVRIMP